MKKIYAFVILICSITVTAIGQVSISTDNSAPDQSAMLDVKSTTKGILAPRVALTAVNVASPITDPAIGLLVYNTIAAGSAPDNVVPGYYRWNGAKWILIEAPQGSSNGDMQYWNGSQWVLIPAGTYGQQLFFCNGIPTWGGCPPMLTTAPVTNITYNSAISGGNITLDGGSAIVTTGVCWSIHPNPTIYDSITTDGSGIGSFVSNITGLSPNTTYHVRSYATNSAGTGYGNEETFTTPCEFYPTVSVLIEASTNPVCEGSIVSIQATPTNGGLLPVYQWKVNGVSVGTNNSVLMYTPSDNDTVKCFLTSSLPCTSALAASNAIIITVNPMLAVGVTITASDNNVCQGDTVTLTATVTNAGTISNYQWKLGGNIINGAITSIYSYVPANNDVITCVFTSNPPCSLSNSATSNSITLTVISPPVSPSTGTHVSSQAQIIWNWSPVSGATGYKWNTTNDYISALDMGTITTKTEAGFTCDSAYSRFVWAYNSCGNSTSVILTQSTSQCAGSGFTCGQTLTINHVAGAVAPVNKTTTYGTVSNIPGEPSKCWITSNLGSDHQATSVNDATEASAGWYWQFNRKQGYKHNGSTPTPGWTITNINENSDWLPANDPCTIELGSQWRIPNYTEWNNVDNNSSWTNWNGPFASLLKLHAAGYIFQLGNLDIRGVVGYYYSGTQFNSNAGWHLYFGSTYCVMNNWNDSKADGMSLRCIRESCAPALSPPTPGTNSATPIEIIWNWNPVAGAAGYKWNFANDYGSAIDMGTSTTNTEIGLTCNTPYTRYVWAYNTCGTSIPETLNQTTSACGGTPCVGTVSYGGQTYNAIQIGTQCWLKENLNIGTMISGSLDQTNNGVIEKYCYNDLESNCSTYGGLYQWNEIMQYVITQGAQGVCPYGWHIPTDSQWLDVTTFLGGGYMAGGKMKTIGTIQAGTGLWNSPNTSATNESGFSAVPAGYRHENGTFNSVGNIDYWWCTLEYGINFAWYRQMNYTSGIVSRNYNSKTVGLSVRCLRD